MHSEYDGAGRISAVNGQRANLGESLRTYIANPTYTAHGALLQADLGSSVMRETAIYNSRLQPTQMELRKVSGNLLQLDYTYGTTNNNGNVLTQCIFSRIPLSTLRRPTLMMKSIA